MEKGLTTVMDKFTIGLLSILILIINETFQEVEIIPDGECFLECKQEIDLEIVFTQDVTWTYQVKGTGKDNVKRGYAKQILNLVNKLRTKLKGQYNGTRLGYTTFSDYDQSVKGNLTYQEAKIKELKSQKGRGWTKQRTESYEEGLKVESLPTTLGNNRPKAFGKSAAQESLCYKLVKSLTEDDKTVIHEIYKQTWFYSYGQKDDEESAATGILYTAADPKVGWTKGNKGANGHPLLKIIVLLTNEDTVQWNSKIQESLDEPKGLGQDTCNMRIPTDEVIRDTLKRQGIRLLGLVSNSTNSDHRYTKEIWRKHFHDYLNDTSKYAVEDVRFGNEMEANKALDSIQKMIDKQAAAVCQETIICNKRMKSRKRQALISWRNHHLKPNWRNGRLKQRIECVCSVDPNPTTPSSKYVPNTTLKPSLPPTTHKPSPSPTTPKPSHPPATTKPSLPPTTRKPSPPPTTHKPSPPPTTPKPSHPPATTKPLTPPTTRKPSPPPTTHKTSTTSTTRPPGRRKRTRRPKNTIGLK